HPPAVLDRLGEATIFFNVREIPVRRRSDGPEVEETLSAGSVLQPRYGAIGLTSHPPRKKLQEDTAQHQGGYRCCPTPGRIKILLPGTAEAPSMSAGGRVVLYILSIFMPASMMSSETGMKLAGPREQAPQEGHDSNPPASVTPSPIIEPTVVSI